MVGKRGVYLNFLGVFILLASLFFLNATVLNDAIPDAIFRILNISDFQEREVISMSAWSESLERENASLRKQLGVGPKSPQKLVVGRIISTERNILLSTVIINKGKTDGVLLDQIVLGPGNVLVGKILDTYEHTSKVMLADDPRMIISVRVQGTSLLAESRGSGHNTIDVSLVSHNELAEKGNILVTSGLDTFSDGFAVAKISEIESGSNSLFQKIRGDTLFSFHESPLLFIVM